MCIAYTIKYATCEHKVFLGTQACDSTSACQVEFVHLFCLVDSINSCNACALLHGIELDPDLQPVLFEAAQHTMPATMPYNDDWQAFWLEPKEEGTQQDQEEEEEVARRHTPAPSFASLSDVDSETEHWKDATSVHNTRVHVAASQAATEVVSASEYPQANTENQPPTSATFASNPSSLPQSAPLTTPSRLTLGAEFRPGAVEHIGVREQAGWYGGEDGTGGDGQAGEAWSAYAAWYASWYEGAWGY